MSRPPLEAVLFDLDDTLHDDTAAYRAAAARVADEVAAERGADASRLLGAYVEEAEAFWRDLAPEHLGRPLVGLRAAMWARALEACGLAADPALAERCAAA